MGDTGDTGETGDMSCGLYREACSGGADMTSSSRKTDTGEIFLLDLFGRSGDRFLLALNAVS
jgi:hypothetical protein